MSGKTPTPGTSVAHPRAFPHILPKSRIKPGEIYDGWPCKSCGLVIPIDPDAPASVRMPDARVVRVICPHCEKADNRIWADASEILYEPCA
jgi:hypothetical protein